MATLGNTFLHFAAINALAARYARGDPLFAVFAAVQRVVRAAGAGDVPTGLLHLAQQCATYHASDMTDIIMFKALRFQRLKGQA